MAELVDLFVPLEDVDAPLPTQVARALGRPAPALGLLRLLRRTLDTRKGRTPGFRLRVEVRTPGEPGPPPRPARPRWPTGRPTPRVVIVGSGPAGAWAALRLAEAGIPSTIVERGKPVQPRRHDLAALTRGRLDPESNYCFGEGGAGTYSDGKLYTRSKDRGAVAEVLADLVRFGAPAEIEIDARPHVGSNLLPKVLTALRRHLEAAGVTYRFGARADGLRVQGGRVRGLRLGDGDELPADVVILATGHSARDVYAWLATAGVALERKASALGVRIEHPQPLIDRLQYGAAAGHPALPAAFYELAGEGAGRGVWSFCMCPGGWIVPAATEGDGVVTNGMSLARRDSPFANAGLVVAVEPGDYGPDGDGPLAGLAFQRGIECAAFTAGGGAFRAPAQRLADFLAGRPSRRVAGTSYRPGTTPGDLSRVLPPFVAAALRAGLGDIGRRVPGYLFDDAVLVATETRTSSPVRVMRDSTTFESPSVQGLYPAGEGAGFAGGIVSAALDGARIAQAIVARGGA